jgi:hypothetical protein
LPAWFRQSRQRQALCRLAPGEVLAKPSIFKMERGLRDRQLQQLPGLEKQLAADEKS